MESIIKEVLSLKTEDMQKRRREDKKEWVKTRRDVIDVPRKRVRVNPRENEHASVVCSAANKTLPHSEPSVPGELGTSSSKTSTSGKK